MKLDKKVFPSLLNSWKKEGKNFREKEDQNLSTSSQLFLGG